MKTIFKYSDLKDAVAEFVEVLEFKSGYKVDLYFWEDGTISNSGIMQKNSSNLFFGKNPIFTYWTECEEIDENATEEEALEIKNKWQDFILEDVVNKIEEENYFSENTIIIEL